MNHLGISSYFLFLPQKLPNPYLSILKKLSHNDFHKFSILKLKGVPFVKIYVPLSGTQGVINKAPVTIAISISLDASISFHSK